MSDTGLWGWIHLQTLSHWHFTRSNWDWDRFCCWIYHDNMLWTGDLSSRAKNTSSVEISANNGLDSFNFDLEVRINKSVITLLRFGKEWCEWLISFCRTMFSYTLDHNYHITRFDRSIPAVTFEPNQLSTKFDLTECIWTNTSSSCKRWILLTWKLRMAVKSIYSSI